VRRIEAATGAHAYRFMKERSRAAVDVARALNVPVDKISAEVEKRNQRIRELEKELSRQKMGGIKASIDDIVASADVIAGVKVIARVMDALDMGLLRANVDLIREKAQSAVVALGSASAGKALLVVGVTPDLVARGFDAGALVRQISAPIGGSGGGRKDFAQAGGNRPEAFDESFRILTESVRTHGLRP
jgi:alanyl-tRNA synthetase